MNQASEYDDWDVMKIAVPEPIEVVEGGDSDQCVEIAKGYYDTANFYYEKYEKDQA